VACDSAKYTHVSREIFGLLHEFSPMVEHSTIDEFDLDISGLEAFFGPPLELGKIIKKRIREALGLTCSVGVAPTWLLAKLGTKIKKPDGLVLINEANLNTFLKGLPVEKICGIGPALSAHLAGLGILTCDQLKTLSENILTDNFGLTTGHWLYQSLRTNENLGYMKGDIDTSRYPKSIGHSYTLPSEIHDQKIVFSWLRMLSEMVAQRARKTKCSGKTVSLWVNSRKESFLRQKTYQLPTQDGWEIFTRSKGLFGQKNGISRPVRALGVSLQGLVFDEAPPLLVEQKRREALLEAQDKINEKYGDWTLVPAVLSEIHPE
jgi:DNA polymerase-4